MGGYCAVGDGTMQVTVKEAIVNKPMVTERLKEFVRKLPCYDFGDTAPSEYGAFCREKRQGLDWNECAVCHKAQGRS